MGKAEITTWNLPFRPNCVQGRCGDSRAGRRRRRSWRSALQLMVEEPGNNGQRSAAIGWLRLTRQKRARGRMHVHRGSEFTWHPKPGRGSFILHHVTPEQRFKQGQRECRLMRVNCGTCRTLFLGREDYAEWWRSVSTCRDAGRDVNAVVGC